MLTIAYLSYSRINIGTMVWRRHGHHIQEVYISWGTSLFKKKKLMLKTRKMAVIISFSDINITEKINCYIDNFGKKSNFLKYFRLRTNKHLELNTRLSRIHSGLMTRVSGDIPVRICCRVLYFDSVWSLPSRGGGLWGRERKREIKKKKTNKKIERQQNFEYLEIGTSTQLNNIISQLLCSHSTPRSYLNSFFPLGLNIVYSS